jgi:hypothetical protein
MPIANSNQQGEESHTPLKPNRTRKPSKRRRKKLRARDEYVGYAMRAASWDYYFSFHISDPKSRWDPGPYSRLARFPSRVILSVRRVLATTAPKSISAPAQA